MEQTNGRNGAGVAQVLRNECDLADMRTAFKVQLSYMDDQGHSDDRIDAALDLMAESYGAKLESMGLYKSTPEV